VLAHGWQTIPEKGVVRSRGPFKSWRAPTISLEWLQVELSHQSSQVAVNLGGRSVW